VTSRCSTARRNFAWRESGISATLVEEEGAALGGAEDAVVVVHGAGERPAAVAEELAVEQRLGEPRTVDGDEGMGGERAALVDGARDQLLPRAALRRSPGPCSCCRRRC